MAARKRGQEASGTRRKPATTPEAREQQLIALSTDLAEQQIREGTASSQVITHFLKMGAPREQLERQRLERESKLMDAKIEAMASQGRMEELYEGAISAMRAYSGDVPPPPEVDVED